MHLCMCGFFPLQYLEEKRLWTVRVETELKYIITAQINMVIFSVEKKKNLYQPGSPVSVL